MRFLLLLSLLVPDFTFCLAGAVEGYQEFDRGKYIDIDTEPKYVTEAYNKFKGSSKPIHFTLYSDRTLSEKHFLMLSEMPLTYLRISNFEPDLYAEGLVKLETLDSLELEGRCHPFLDDASRIPALKYLRLEIFIPDSTILRKPSFDSLQTLSISLMHFSDVLDLSKLFAPIKTLRSLEISKSCPLDLDASFSVVKDSPLVLFSLGLCALRPFDTTLVILPFVERAVLWSCGNKDLPVTDLIKACPNLKEIDITANGISKKYANGLRQRFPAVKIRCDY